MIYFPVIPQHIIFAKVMQETGLLSKREIDRLAAGWHHQYYEKHVPWKPGYSQGKRDVKERFARYRPTSTISGFDKRVSRSILHAMGLKIPCAMGFRRSI